MGRRAGGGERQAAAARPWPSRRWPGADQHDGWPWLDVTMVDDLHLPRPVRQTAGNLARWGRLPRAVRRRYARSEHVTPPCQRPQHRSSSRTPPARHAAAEIVQAECNLKTWAQPDPHRGPWDSVPSCSLGEYQKPRLVPLSYQDSPRAGKTCLLPPTTGPRLSVQLCWGQSRGDGTGWLRACTPTRRTSARTSCGC